MPKWQFVAPWQLRRENVQFVAVYGISGAKMYISSQIVAFFFQMCYDEIAEGKGLPSRKPNQKRPKQTHLYQVLGGFFMKHISRRLTAISAAAITAVSALSATGLTAHAFHFTAQTDLNHLDIDAQAWADFENSKHP